MHINVLHANFFLLGILLFLTLKYFVIQRIYASGEGFEMMRKPNRKP